MLRSQLTLSLHGIVLIAVLILSCGAAFAEDIASATYMMRGCREAVATPNKDNALPAMCVGTIDGIAFGSGTCFPTGVTVDQLVRVVVQYIDSRPARMHEDFRRLALEALQAAWPCKR
jgi:Rap1a immunity proteins